MPKYLLLIYLLALVSTATADDDLHVSVEPTKDGTGNMHYSEWMRLQIGDSKPALLKTEHEKSVLAPSEVLLTERIDKNSLVVFAYSSTGGGRETLHVLLLSRANQTTLITDHLKMNIRRSTGGFLWTDKARLYAVQPEESLDDDDLFLESSRIALKYSRIKDLNFTSSPEHATLIQGMFRGISHPHKKQLKVSRILFSNGHFNL